MGPWPRVRVRVCVVCAARAARRCRAVCGLPTTALGAAARLGRYACPWAWRVRRGDTAKFVWCLFGRFSRIERVYASPCQPVPCPGGGLRRLSQLSAHAQHKQQSTHIERTNPPKELILVRARTRRRSAAAAWTSTRWHPPRPRRRDSRGSGWRTAAACSPHSSA